MFARKSVSIIVPLFFLTCLSRYATAQLTWDDRQVTLHPDVQERQVSGKFQFTNVGPAPIEFVGVKPSCGCTTTKMEKKLYQPGESGTINATFTIGSRTGLQQKDIAVTTTDPSTPVTILTLRVFVPDVMHISEDRVVWHVGEPNAERKVRIDVMDHAFNITGVSSTNDTFVPSLTTLEPGKSYEVSITPKSTTQEAKGSIRVKTDSLQRPLIHLLTFVNSS